FSRRMLRRTPSSTLFPYTTLFRSVSFLTSKGYNRNNGNKTRARWVHIGGTVNGKLVGVAILGHPDNFRAPQPVRINPETPYMVLDRKSTRLNSSHVSISYAVFCLK